LGVQWDVRDTIQPGVNDPGWRAVWIRRGSSNTFDGRWKRDGEPDVAAILTVNVEGNKVTVERQDYPSKWSVIDCLYEGTLAGDGEAAFGRVTCRNSGGKLGPFNWESRITCGADQGRIAGTGPGDNRNTDDKETGNKEDANRDGGNREGGGGQVYEVNWDTYPSLPHLNLRGKVGQRATFKCPPNGKPEYIWGTDIYTDDSRVCLAAVHAGLITFASGGEVTIEMLPGQKNYRGTERHGVTSSDYNSPTDYYTSYRFAGGGRLNNVAGPAQPAAGGGAGGRAPSSTSPASASPTKVTGLRQKAPGGEQRIKLRLLVKGPDGTNLSGANVNVWHNYSSLRVTPPDYQELEGHASGLVEIDVVAGKSEKVTVQVNKGDLTAQVDIELTGPVVSRTIELKQVTNDLIGRDAADLIKVRVYVESEKPGEKGEPIYGARVAFGYLSGSNRTIVDGFTGPDGAVTIPVLNMDYWIEVSKEGYQPAESKVLLNYRQKGKTIDAPTIKLKPIAKKNGNEVKVIAEVTQEGVGSNVEGAEIVLTGKGGPASGSYRKQTGANGKAEIIVGEYGRFEVQISHRDFAPYQGEVEISKGDTEKSLGPVLLKKLPKRGEGTFVKVTVLAGDKKNVPIKGASVTVGPSIGYTDAEGKASVPAEFGIDALVLVTAKATGYKSESKNLRVQRGLDLTEKASGTIILQPGEDPATEETPFKLLVHVLNSSDNTPIDGASVSFFTESGEQVTAGPARTTKEGVLLEGSGNPPHSVLRKGIRLNVTAAGYEKKENILVPGIDIDRDLLKPSNEPVRFTVFLKPVIAENTPINIAVEVSSYSRARERGAVVELLFSGKTLQTKLTDEQGNASFTLTGGPEASLWLLRAGLRVAVSTPDGVLKPEYKDLTAEQLKPSKEALRVEFVLQRDWDALSRIIGEIEKEVVAWNKDYRQARSKLDSVSEKAEQLALAVKRVEGLAGEIDAATAQTIIDAAAYCLKSDEMRTQAQSAETEAKQKEQELVRRLDAATAKARSCQSAEGANEMKSNHQAAARLAIEIGLLERKTAQKLAGITKFAEAARRKLSEMENHDRTINAELSAAERMLAVAEADFKRGSETSGSLSSRRKDLQLQINYLGVFESDNAALRKEVPADVKKRLETVEGLLWPGDTFPIPNANLLQAARDGMARLQEIKSSVAQLLADYENSLCDTRPMSDALENIRASLNGATIELGAANDLPNKADACAARGACQPLVAQMRALLDAGNLKGAEALLPQLEMTKCDTSGLKRELDSRTASEVAEFLNQSKENCLFQDALNLAQQLPQSVKDMPPVRAALSDVGKGLNAQKRIAKLREEARQAVARTGQATSADSFIAQAELFAEAYPCLAEEARSFKDGYADRPRVMGQSETKENESEVSAIEKPEDADRPRRKVIEVPEDQGAAAAPARPRDRTGVIPVPEPSPEEDDRPQRGVIPVPEDDNRPSSAGDTPPESQPPTTESPAAPPGGGLRLLGPEVTQKSRRETYNAVVYKEYAFTAASATTRNYGDYGNFEIITWNFSGMPGSLSPGQEFTITITGSLQINAGRDLQPHALAGVASEGLEVVSQQRAVLSASRKGDGKYVFRVPLNATKARISIWGDFMSTFAVYRYEK
jgi:hypothetical protein